MRQQLWRQDIESYSMRATTLPRLADVDTLHHLNNVAVLGFHAEARTRWQMSALRPDSWKQMQPMLRPVSISADFIDECNFPDAIETGVQLTGIGPDSWHIASALFQGACVGMAECEMAAWENGMRCAVPDETLALLLAQPLRDDSSAPPDDMDVKPLSAYVRQMEVQSRYSDHDAHGCVSEFAIARYTEHARFKLVTELFQSVRKRGVRTPYNNLVANIRIRFLRHASAPLRWQMGTEIVKVGRSSIKMRTAIFDHDVCHAIYDCVIVVVDRDTRKATEIPRLIREKLADMQPA